MDFQDALERKDRYAAFLKAQGRLSARGDIQNLEYALPLETIRNVHGTIGAGQSAQVRAYDVQISEDQQLALASRIMYTNVVPTNKNDTRAIDAKEATIVQEAGWALGLSLDRDLDTVIAPLVGYQFGSIPMQVPAKKDEPAYTIDRDVFLLYQPRAITTLERAYAEALKQLPHRPEMARAVVSLVNGTARLALDMVRAGYADTDFKAPNIGMYRDDATGDITLRTIDIDTIVPIGAWREALGAYENGDALVPHVRKGSMYQLTTSLLSDMCSGAMRANATDEHELTIAVAVTLARGVFDLYGKADHERPCASLMDRVLDARHAFVDGTTPARHPSLEPYRAPLARAIRADLDGRAYNLGDLCRNLARASAYIRAKSQ